jgi:hypothetical protein
MQGRERLRGHVHGHGDAPRRLRAPGRQIGDGLVEIVERSL